MEQPGAHLADLADETQRRVDLRCLEEAAILARDPDRDGLEHVDRAHQLAVDLADQHHADDVERFGVGDAQAVDALDGLALALHLRVDLRSAAVDQHRANPHRVEQEHVLGEARARSGSVIGTPPTFTTTTLPVKRRI